MAQEFKKGHANKAELISKLTAIADSMDSQQGQGKGNDIRTLIQELNDNKRDPMEVKINARINIDKFNGEKVSDDQEPDDTAEFVTEL